MRRRVKKTRLEFFWENLDIQFKHSINRLPPLSALAYIDLYFLCLCVINRLWIGAHFLILGQKARKIATAAVMRLSNWCKFAIMSVMDICVHLGIEGKLLFNRKKNNLLISFSMAIIEILLSLEILLSMKVNCWIVSVFNNSSSNYLLMEIRVSATLSDDAVAEDIYLVSC